ncbi:hypothetical protein PR202_gb08807 [Eleusine coracana subsp. coracana]|uniref:Cytochrome P450 n=1 Tax=Eleusine coracana subsp. coracana TaxID=191504 RepID=A0AAV5EDZ3_ELECO|nr:hypothetical protein PR202_gb08807 [Eleusine coracana subsp. coracana]
MAGEGSSLLGASPLILSLATLLIAVLCKNFVGASNKWPRRVAINKESVLRSLGIRLGDIPTTLVLDGAVAVDSLVRRADVFSDRPAGGPSTILSDGRHPNITSVPYGPRWVALRRNITSEAFHPVRGLARAAPQRARGAAALVADIASSSSGNNGDGVVPVRDCLYKAVFALNVATCFGDGAVDAGHVDAMRLAQQEFLGMVPGFRVFATFKKVARLLYRDRWKQAVHCRRRQEELYIPLIRACQERRRSAGAGAGAGGTRTTTSYVDTLLDLEIPVEGDPRRRWKLSEGDMVSLVSEYLGAATGAVVAALEWTLANLVTQPDVQSRLRREVDGEEASCGYVRAVVLEALRRHPPVPAVQRYMATKVMVGSTPVAGGTMVLFSLEDISRDDKVRLLRICY